MMMAAIVPDVGTKPLDLGPVAPYLDLVLVDLPPWSVPLSIEAKPVAILLQPQLVVVEFAFVGAEIACTTFLCKCDACRSQQQHQSQVPACSHPRLQNITRSNCSYLTRI